MYPCPKCGKLYKGIFNKAVKCDCGIYRTLVKQDPPYWMEVQEQALDKNINNLYNKTKLSR